jgi:hypothetical protein
MHGRTGFTCLVLVPDVKRTGMDDMPIRYEPVYRTSLHILSQPAKAKAVVRTSRAARFWPCLQCFRFFHSLMLDSEGAQVNWRNFSVLPNSLNHINNQLSESWWVVVFRARHENAAAVSECRRGCQCFSGKPQEVARAQADTASLHAHVSTLHPVAI